MTMPTNSPATDADVIVVGAGPTGLLLAGDLATAGVRVLVLEKRPAELSNLTRAFAVHARSLEVLDARGLADELLRTGQPVTRVRLFDHLEIDLGVLPTRFPFVLVTPQYEVERQLRRRAEEAGADFRFDTDVVTMRQDDDGVRVDVTDDKGRGSLRGSYLVGADGVRSTVRTTVGAPFPGHTVIRAMVLADVKLRTPPPDVLTVASHAGALGFLAPFGDGRYRFIGWDGEHDVDAPVGDDEVRRIARSTMGTDYGMHDVTFATRFAADERQVPQYRYGRVLLAGDAAHVHSPAGGLGMNTGLQDAANLGWKLASVVRGADASLLDTYEAERHPVGKQVVRASGTILRLATRPGPLVAAARRGVAAVVSRSATIRRRAAGQVSAIDLAYPRPRGSHRLVGRRAPEIPLVPGPAGERLAEALRRGRFVLVLPRPAGHGRAMTARPPLVPGEVSAADRVVVHRADADPTALLVRPDGYIGNAQEQRGE